ncbi:MAG: hypothetical protein IJC04_01590 [Oscillospiraceae bacterium]|nr:hypothetical protein [Oscillospiraceae bacterium]
MINDKFMLGFDYLLYANMGIKAPIYASADSHLIVVGGSGSGKSTAVLYWLRKLQPCKPTLYIADFKASREFGGISQHYAEFENCYKLIKDFYDEFLSTPEGGSGKIKILIIDEIAGLLTHYSMCKETKTKADEIRNIMSSVLMLGRSRRCFLWLSMQRYTANIFPSASGSADNFHILIGLGNLTVDGRKGLFASEHFEGENELQYGQGRGIALIDGQQLRGIIIPQVSKAKLLQLLQC